MEYTPCHNSMNIDSILSKYTFEEDGHGHIKRVGGSPSWADKQWMKTHKKQIEAEWRRRNQVLDTVSRRRSYNVSHMPGFAELVQSKRAWRKWTAAFAKSVTGGKGIPTPTARPVSEIQAEYPDAAFALKVTEECLDESLPQHEAALVAYNKLGDLVPVDAVRKEYEAAVAKLGG